MIRVLVADDHPLIRLSLKPAIESAPDLALCGSAENGITAVSIAQKTVPDVILLDVSMPGGDGIDATRQLKRLLPATRIIILTWLATCEDSARDAGADDFLLKDVHPQTLLDHIRWSARDMNAGEGVSAQPLNWSRDRRWSVRRVT